MSNIEDELFDLLNAPTPTASGVSSTVAAVDLDDLLGSSNNPASTTTTPVRASAQSIEDELFELLNSPSPALNSSIVSEGAAMSASKEPATGLTSIINSSKAAKAADHNELLSWLEETPSKAPVDISDILDSTHDIDVPVTTKESTHSESVAAEPVSVVSEQLHHQEEEPREESSADRFFNDVFGNETVSSNVMEHSKIEEKSFEEKVKEIISSPFPDIGRLRQVIDEAGHIPTHLRVQVLLLLLTGSCNSDEEAQNFNATEVDKYHYSNLVSDCEGLVKACTVDNDPNMIEHMEDIIILYCQRRSIEYKNLFSRILLSIYASDVNTPKSIASSCFYALASNFLPLAGLQYTPLELSVDVLHSWLKLLVTYHCPALVQHLDRVTPGWERPARDISSNQLARYATLLKNNTNLDALEKQLGVDLEYEFESEVHEDDDNNKTPSVFAETSSVPKRLEGGGKISTSWITSYFAGSLPASESAKLLDWSVFNGERFAGLYFVATLLELFSNQLLKMSGAAITQWFDDIATNKSQWYEQCNIPNGFDGKVSNWNQFTSAWIRATSALVSATPSAFRDALNKTEAWAVYATEKQRKEISNHLLGLYNVDKELDDVLEGGHMFDEDDDDDEGNGVIRDNMVNSTVVPEENDEGSPGDDKPADAVNSNNTEGTLLNKASNLIKTFGSKFQITENDDDDDSSHDDSQNSLYPQERKHNDKTLSLWSNASEVIPCVCSNQRRSVAQKGVIATFLESINSSSSSSHICFLLSKYEHELPFYFGIDCRSTEEKELGQFPKAYNLDPSSFSDEESLQSLVSLLEPIASSIHVAIIGAGEEYYRWSYKEKNIKKGQKLTPKDHTEISKLIEEHDKEIQFLVEFLIKKSFKFVSVLDGGFYEAVKYMNRPDSRQTLSNSLVDMDKIKINSLLGISAAPVTNKSAISSLWNEAAPIAMRGVGNLISAWGSSAKPAENASQHATSSTAPVAANNTAPTAAAAAPPAVESKPLLGGWGKNLLGSLENIKKAVVSTVEAQTTKQPVSSQPVAPPIDAEAKRRSSQFVIDEHEDDGMGPREVENNTKISIVKTDQERAQALAIHRMAGLKKGDKIVISRADLPGAVLFPCAKIKEVWVPKPKDDSETNEVGNNDGDQTDPHAGMVKQEQLVNRYLVVSRERFMVLDAHGGGVGSNATVKSNRHLTELIKMTFKKKDPELVTLFVVSSVDDQAKTKQYRVSKHKDFVMTLQKHMERFK